MKAVDTNILLRFVLRDDEQQFVSSSAFLQSRTSDDPAFVGLIVLVEFVWTLRQRYSYGRADTRALVLNLIESAELIFEDEDNLAALVETAVRGDLTDHLIAYVASRSGCSGVVTFDRRAVNAVPAMELLA